MTLTLLDSYQEVMVKIRAHNGTQFTYPKQLANKLEKMYILLTLMAYKKLD
jgi:hypothetical protein